MTKVSLFTVLFFIIFSATAQVSIGRSVSPTNLYIRGIHEKYFDFLETSTSYLIVPESLDFESTKSIISDVWTYNDIVFVAAEDYDEDRLMEKGNAIIRIHDTGYSMQREQHGRATRTVNSWFAYKFELIAYYDVTVNKKGKKNPDVLKLADICFTQSMHHRYKMQPTYKEKKAESFKDEPDFYNFQLGFIKNYFQILNKGLTERRTLDLEEKVIDESNIKLLKNQTLFAPEWILKRVNPFTAILKKVETPEDLFEDYDYSYEMLSHDELNNKILSGEEFYYLMHTQFNEHQILSIINSVTGAIIYSAEKKSYNISSKDIRGISKAISKE